MVANPNVSRRINDEKPDGGTAPSTDFQVFVLRRVNHAVRQFRADMPESVGGAKHFFRRVEHFGQLLPVQFPIPVLQPATARHKTVEQDRIGTGEQRFRHRFKEFVEIFIRNGNSGDRCNARFVGFAKPVQHVLRIRVAVGVFLKCFQTGQTHAQLHVIFGTKFQHVVGHDATVGKQMRTDAQPDGVTDNVEESVFQQRFAAGERHIADIAGVQFVDDGFPFAGIDFVFDGEIFLGEPRTGTKPASVIAPVRHFEHGGKRKGWRGGHRY